MNASRLPRVGARLLGIALVLVFFFGVNEWIARSLSGDSIVLFPRYHTDAQYGEYTLRRMRPGMEFTHTSVDGSWKFSINDRGLRNYDDFDYQKQPGTLRVLVLGDSQAQGYESHQDHTFSAVIDRQLTEYGHTVEVINTGVSGFGTAEELLYLENEGIKYDPDFVVLAYTGNDIRDSVKTDLFRLDDAGHLVVHNRTHIPGVATQNLIYSLPFTQWLGEHSYLYSLLFNEVWSYFKGKLGQEANQRVATLEAPAPEAATPEISTPGDEGMDYGTALTAALLKRMYQFCQANDTRFLVLDIPSRTREDGVRSAFPAALAESVENDGDAFIEAVPLLEKFTGTEAFFVPHGARHISRFTHRELGIATALTIESFLAEKTTERR